jgi:hypothetical protein
MCFLAAQLLKQMLQFLGKFADSTTHFIQAFDRFVAATNVREELEQAIAGSGPIKPLMHGDKSADEKDGVCDNDLKLPVQLEWGAIIKKADEREDGKIGDGEADGAGDAVAGKTAPKGPTFFPGRELVLKYGIVHPDSYRPGLGNG